MNKAELVTRISERTGQHESVVDRIVEAFTEAFVDCAQKGEKLRIKNVFSASFVQRPARKMFNPQTKAEISIPARTVVHFRPGRAIVAAANERS